MTYVDENGEKQYPFVIHRSSIGCYERTLALLIEKYAGAFPLWICPEQVRIMSLTDRTIDYAEEIAASLRQAGVRANTDIRSEKIGYKIREAQMEKIPYMIIVGDKEKEEKTLSVRHRKDGDIGSFSLKDFTAKVVEEDRTKKIF